MTRHSKDTPPVSEKPKQPKRFLLSPRYRPLVRFLFCIIGMFAAFGLLSELDSLQPKPRGLLKLTFIAYLAFFIGAICFFVQYAWTMFVKGGWREEHKRYMSQFEPPKQPWDKE